MNSTQKMGSGRPEGRAREDRRGDGPVEAEGRLELDQEAGQKALDCLVQGLQAKPRSRL